MKCPGKHRVGWEMKTLSIALCITDLEIGGAERCLVELATRANPERFRCVVYCLAPQPKSPQNSCLPMLEAARIETHCLGARGAWLFPWVLRQLRRLLIAQQPHLVQTFLFHGNMVGRIAARNAGVPRVVSGIRVAQRRPRWRLWVDRLTDRLVDRHVCVSGSVARFSQEVGGLPAGKLTVIPNGVDLRRFSARNRADLVPLGVAENRRVVVCVGRLTEQKGLAWLISSAASWLERVPDCDLLLVGRGPMERRLRWMCEELGIGERVHFAGWRADVPEILAASDLLLLPSAWEGMPNIVLEAMASRLPVVATDVEGVAELLGSEAGRQTVPYGDSQALGNKVVTLLENRQEAARLGAENRRRAEERFDLARMVNAYEEVWEVLAER